MVERDTDIEQKHRGQGESEREIQRHITQTFGKTQMPDRYALRETETYKSYTWEIVQILTSNKN